MRWAQISAAIGAILCLAIALPGSAHARPVDAPLHVSQPTEPQATRLAGQAPGQVSFHEVRLGDRSLPARGGYGRDNGERVIDATGLGLGLGSRFESQGTEIRFDRPQTGVRAILDLPAGVLWADGKRMQVPDAAGVVSGGRLWLNAEALQALTGNPVTVEGLPQQKQPQRPPQGAHRGAEQGRLVLASWSPDEAPSARSERTREPLQAHPAKATDLSGVFGRRLVQTASETAGRHDWRTADSWQIETHVAAEEQGAPIEATVPTQISGGGATAMPAAAQARSPQSRETASAVEGRVQTAKLKAPAPPSLKEVPRSAGSVAKPGHQKAAYIQAAEERSQNGLLWQAGYRPAAGSSEMLRPTIAAQGLANSALVQTYEARGASELYDRRVAIPAVWSQPRNKRQTDTAMPAPETTDGAQIDGRIFLDKDGDGRPSAGDQRFEGEVFRVVNLATSETIKRRTAAFGQFGLNNLRPGRYRLTVMLGWQEHKMTLKVLPGDSTLEVDFAVPFDGPDPDPGEGVSRIASLDSEALVRRIR